MSQQYHCQLRTQMYILFTLNAVIFLNQKCFPKTVNAFLLNCDAIFSSCQLNITHLKWRNFIILIFLKSSLFSANVLYFSTSVLFFSTYFPMYHPCRLNQSNTAKTQSHLFWDTGYILNISILLGWWYGQSLEIIVMASLFSKTNH